MIILVRIWSTSTDNTQFKRLAKRSYTYFLGISFVSWSLFSDTEIAFFYSCVDKNISWHVSLRRTIYSFLLWWRIVFSITKNTRENSSYFIKLVINGHFLYPGYHLLPKKHTTWPMALWTVSELLWALNSIFVKSGQAGNMTYSYRLPRISICVIVHTENF